MLNSHYLQENKKQNTNLSPHQYVLMESRNISHMSMSKGRELKVQNLLATECFTLQFEYTLIVLCVILAYYTVCMRIYFI